MTEKHVKKSAIILCVCFACMMLEPAAYSIGFIRHNGNGYRPARVLPRGHVPMTVRGHRYYYHHGLFYRHHRSNFVLVAPPIGAIVPLLPLGFLTIMLGGMAYYCYEGLYYRECPSGYIVVPESEYIEKKRYAERKSEKNVEKIEGLLP